METTKQFVKLEFCELLQAPLPLPLGEVPQFANWGGEGFFPLSQKSSIFASSPNGGAEAAFVSCNLLINSNMSNR